MKRIPIVFSTDNNFKYALISLTSLIVNAARDTFYKIYFLIDDDFFLESQCEIKEYLKDCGNVCSLHFINVGHIFSGVSMQLKGITKPTFFRLLIPQLLKEERCIYLDTDVVVREDLQELYNVPMEDYYVAGVKAPSYILSTFLLGFNKEEYCRQALLPDLEHYINTGVLVMNLKKMRQDDLVSRFLELLPMNMKSMDQDIINSACYGRILILPFEYNVMTKYAKWTLEDYNGIYSATELRRAWNEPKIIHYADKIKPWNNLNCELGEVWWDICKRSSLWEYFFNKMRDEFFLKAIYQAPGKEFSAKKISGLFDIRYDRNYVIYGAGKRAKEVILYFKKQGVIPEFIIVSERNDTQEHLEGIPIMDINTAEKYLKDKTIIIATLEKFQTEILVNLTKFDYKECIPISDGWKSEGLDESNI